MSFSENIIQTSHVNVYFPGAANCTGNTTCNANTPVATCSGCDWEFAQVTCNQGCPSQPACSTVDGNTCPNLGQNVQYQWETGTNGTCPVEPVVRCTYDASTFNYSDVLRYQEAFCDSGSCSENDNFNTIIMPEFCFKSTTICPIVPGTQSSWESCPNILSNISGQDSDNPGATCSAWASNNTSIANSTMSSHCAANPSDVTCQCVNRANSDVFNYINNGMQQSGNFSPACWYTACANPQAFLVPSSLTGANCDITQTCARVNQIIATTPTNLTIQQLQAELNCDITATPTQTNTSSTTSTSPIVTDNTIGSVSTTSTWTWVIIIIIVVIIILIILFFLFYSTRATESTLMVAAV